MRFIVLVVILLLVSACTYIPPSLEPASNPPARSDPSLSVTARTPSPTPVPATPSTTAVGPARAERPGDPLQIWCDSPLFSPSLFDEPADDELEDHPSAAALRRAIVVAGWPEVQSSGWRRVARDAASATYVQGAGPVYYYFLVVVEAQRWTWKGRLGECTFRPDLDGHTPVTWIVDPAFPAPKATSKVLHLLVQEQACASGQSVIDRLLAPAIVYEPEGVFITFAALPLPGDGQDCPGNPAEAVTVRLREPLGDRALRGWDMPCSDCGG